MIEFQRICLVGLDGLIGSFALGLKRVGFRGTVVGVADTKTIQQCWKLKILTEGYQQLEEAIPECDLVILSSKAGELGYGLSEALKLVPRGCVISEMTRVNGDVNDVFEKSGRSEVHYVGFRLVADRLSQMSIEDAGKFFFEHKSVILTPRGKDDYEAFTALQQLMRKMGANIVAMSPQAHDSLLADLSHMPRLASMAVLKQVFDGNRGTKVSHDLLSVWLMDQVTDLRMLQREGWIDDVRANKELVLKSLATLRAGIDSIVSDINGDRLAESVNELMELSGIDTEGFNSGPHHDIFLTSGADPKVLEKVSQLLAEARISIQKLQRLNDMETGSFRVSLGSSLERERAFSILKSAGVPVHDS